MATVIQPHRDDMIEAVRDFNSRWIAGGADPEFQFPETSISDGPPQEQHKGPFEEVFLAVEDGIVRGGYLFKHQNFSIRGEVRSIGYYHLPMSEGVFNRMYATVGVQMLRSALKAQPLTYLLGMGGYDRPLPRMLKASGWMMVAVPFYFRVTRPGRFLKEIRALRTSRIRGYFMTLAAVSGAGWFGIKTLQWTQSLPIGNKESASADPVDGFLQWADELWERSGKSYEMIAVRDSRSLNILYPASSKRFLRVRVLQGGDVIGWAVLLDTLMQGDKYFGNLRVGTVVDCLALPADAAAVVRATTKVLEDRGVDLIITNQSHTAWRSAFRRAGFFEGPSNFIFAASPQLSKLLGVSASTGSGNHINRGDGDGPVHL